MGAGVPCRERSKRCQNAGKYTKTIFGWQNRNIGSDRSFSQSDAGIRIIPREQMEKAEAGEGKAGRNRSAQRRREEYLLVVQGDMSEL